MLVLWPLYLTSSSIVNSPLLPSAQSISSLGFWVTTCLWSSLHLTASRCFSLLLLMCLISSTFTLRIPWHSVFTHLLFVTWLCISFSTSTWVTTSNLFPLPLGIFTFLFHWLLKPNFLKLRISFVPTFSRWLFECCKIGFVCVSFFEIGIFCFFTILPHSHFFYERFLSLLPVFCSVCLLTSYLKIFFLLLKYTRWSINLWFTDRENFYLSQQELGLSKEKVISLSHLTLVFWVEHMFLSEVVFYQWKTQSQLPSNKILSPINKEHFPISIDRHELNVGTAFKYLSHC